MADAFGARLVKEVQMEDLNDLLSNLIATLPLEHNPTIPPLPFLMELLVLQRPPPILASTAGHEATVPVLDTTILSSPSSPSSPPSSSSPPLQPQAQAQHGIVPGGSTSLTYAKPPIIEITSSTSSASRTQLVNHLMILLLKPPQHSGSRPKGLIVYFDCAYKLAIQELYSALLTACNGDEDLAKDTLSRLHVIYPESSRGLLAQIRKVEAYLFSLFSRDVIVAAIVLADLSVFYWSERWVELEARFQQQSSTATTKTSLQDRAFSRDSLHTMILAEVVRLQKVFRCVVIVSGLGVPITATATAAEGSLNVKTGLAGPWAKAVDIKVVLGKNVEGRTQIEIDGRKWVASCGGGYGMGKARCELVLSADSVELSELKYRA